MKIFRFGIHGHLPQHTNQSRQINLPKHTIIPKHTNCPTTRNTALKGSRLAPLAALAALATLAPLAPLARRRVPSHPLLHHLLALMKLLRLLGSGTVEVAGKKGGNGTTVVFAPPVECGRQPHHCFSSGESQPKGNRSLLSRFPHRHHQVSALGKTRRTPSPEDAR